MMKISDFLESRLGVRLIPTRKGYTCCCPIHGETEPSFAITEHEDGHEEAYCFGACPKGHKKFWDVVGIIRHLPEEMGGFGHLTNQTEAFYQAHRRAEEWRLVEPGEEAPAWNAKRTGGKTSEKVFPRAVHRLAMTRAFAHMHECLIGPEGAGARDYLTHTRKLDGPYFQHILPTIGYMPIDQGVHHRIMDELRSLFNGEAAQIAREIGLLTEEHKPRLTYRLIFAVIECGEVVWYQARAASDGHKRGRFLNPPVFSKRFYAPLAPHAARLQGTRIVEGPTDTVAFTSQGIYALGLMGADNIPTIEELRAMPQPLYCYLDNSVLDKAGASAAQILKARCEEGNLPLIFPYFPPGIKDPAQWRASVGSEAFYAAQVQGDKLWRQSQPAPSPAANPAASPVAISSSKAS